MARIETQYSSPSHSGRAGRPPRMIVLHATAGSFHSSLSWLCNPASKVSTHYLISKTGRVLRLVSEDRAAWHAGVSQWFDLDSADIQRESIGIELENNNSGNDPYPTQQLDALVELCRPIIQRYRIAPDMVVRHKDIAIPRGRKTDPAGFPWEDFKRALYAPAARSYRAKACAPVFQDRKPDAPLAGVISAGAIEQVDDLTGGWVHLKSGLGFSPVSCWELIQGDRAPAELRTQPAP